MSADFHFLRPLWLLALPALWALVGWYLRSRARGGAWARVCDAALLPFVTDTGTQRANTRVGALVGVGVTLAVLALAGPTWERLPVPVFRSESALVLALDLSTSMNAADLKPTRLERAKYKVADILRQRRSGQTALVVFAAQAFTVTPLTDDGATIAAQLQALDTRIMPSQGSALGPPIELGAKLLGQAGAPKGHIVLLTDGAESDALARARRLAADGDFRLSVIAVGTRDGAPVPDVAGGFYKTPQGEIVMSRVDMDGLRALAAAGRGLFTEITADDTDVNRLIDFLERDLDAHNQRMEQLAADQWYEVGPWLLLPLLPLAALAFRRGILIVFAVAGLGAFVPRDAAADWWRTPDQAGERAFHQGRYGDAARQFDNREWRGTAKYKAGDFTGSAEDLSGIETDTAHYNRGNALARLGNFAEAEHEYDAALALNPANQDAKHARDIVSKLVKPPPPSDGQGGGMGGQSDQSNAKRQREEESAARTPSKDSAGDARRADGKPSDQDATADAALGKPTDTGSPDQDGKKPIPVPDKDGEKHAPNADKAEGKVVDRRDESAAERAQATEQWLRQVPDDPSGLLRRKFEYQYKEIYGDQPSEGQPW